MNNILQFRLLWCLLAILAMPSAAGVKVGQNAPELILPSLSADQPSIDLSLASLQGQVVYLDFWASWCGPCRVSFPQLEQLRTELGPRGFEVLAVNLDDSEEDARRFLADIKVTYPVVRDASGDTPRTYGILGMPTGFLIDRVGVVRLVHQGYRKSDGDALRAAIVELLGE